MIIKESPAPLGTERGEKNLKLTSFPKCNIHTPPAFVKSKKSKKLKKIKRNYFSLTNWVCGLHREQILSFLKDVLNCGKDFAGGEVIEVALVNKRKKGEAIREYIEPEKILDWWVQKTQERLDFQKFNFYFSPFLTAESDIFDLINKKSVKGLVGSIVLDVDNEKDLSPSAFKKQILTQIKNAPVKPSIIVWSGKGAHLYILLKKKYIENGSGLGLLSIYNKLATIYGADRGASYNRRYMRSVPFSFNYKYSKPRQILIQYLDEIRYSIAELQTLIANYDNYVENDPLKSPTIDFVKASKGFIPMENTLSPQKEMIKFWGALKRDKKLRDIYNGRKKYSTASEYSFALARALALRGFSRDFTRDILRDWQFGIVKNTHRVKEQSEKEIERRLNKIVGDAYKVSIEAMLTANMKGNEYYSPERLAKLTGLPRSAILKQLKLWQSVEIVKVRYRYEKNRKRKKTLYNLLTKKELSKKHAVIQKGERGRKKSVKKYKIKKSILSPSIVRKFEKTKWEFGIIKKEGGFEAVFENFRRRLESREWKTLQDEFERYSRIQGFDKNKMNFKVSFVLWLIEQIKKRNFYYENIRENLFNTGATWRPHQKRKEKKNEVSEVRTDVLFQESVGV